MNPLNYASLEASKRLVDKGIVIETEMSWTYVSEDGKGWIIVFTPITFKSSDYIPAPSMAEVWRELPESWGEDYGLSLQKAFDGKYTQALFERPDYLMRDMVCPVYKSSLNPTDALIYLLIWVRKEKA